uniref:PCNA-associated factor histone-like domain-containing protein n=1 Tax=Meleagris gallopavo TaxID=9103 RepID=A0A803XV31_MELGA
LVTGPAAHRSTRPARRRGPSGASGGDPVCVRPVPAWQEGETKTFLKHSDCTLCHGVPRALGLVSTESKRCVLQNFTSVIIATVTIT